MFRHGTQKEVIWVPMYILTKNCRRVENKDIVLFGVADESHDYGDFTDDMTKAENFVELLNSERVESVHVPEIIEDMFY